MTTPKERLTAAQRDKAKWITFVNAIDAAGRCASVCKRPLGSEDVGAVILAVARKPALRRRFNAYVRQLTPGRAALEDK